MWFLSFNLELICMSEFFKKLRLHELLWWVQSLSDFFRQKGGHKRKNKQQQLYSKVKETNSISYSLATQWGHVRDPSGHVYQSM